MAIDEPEAKKLRVSSPEARERLLAEALAHAEQQDAQYKRMLPSEAATGQWKASLSLVVFALAAYIALAPPTWLASGGQPPTQAQFERGAQAALRLQALQIEVFQLRNAQIPRSLDEMPAVLPGIRYVRSNNRVYQLVAAGPTGEAIIYDSARREDAIATLIDTWLEQAGS